MNLFELFATISLDTSEYEKNLDKAGKGFSDFGSKLKSGLATAAKIGAGFTTAITAGAGGAIAALNGIAESTEESRIATGKLNTAFEAAGMSTEAAATAYNEFYKILGDTDTATEASQLLAQLAENEQDLTEWTRIAAGVNGTFGDSLPIEALIESANETAKVGQVTGNLADALNWVGISEDEFNAKLAAASSESERNRLIMETLSGTYDEASKAFYKNNDALIKQRENQVKLDNILSGIGTTITNLKNLLTGAFTPAIVEMSEGVSELVNGAMDKLSKLVVSTQNNAEKSTSALDSMLSGLENAYNENISALDKQLSEQKSLYKQQDEALEKSIENQIEAYEESNEAKLEALKSAHDEEVSSYEAATEKIISSINKRYEENLKLVDEEKYNQLKAIQEQIDAINAEQAADDKAAKQREENAKKAALQEEIRNAETAEERQKAQKELNDYLADLEANRIKEQRKSQIEALKAEQDEVKAAADKKKEQLVEAQKAETDAVKAEREKGLEEIKKANQKELSDYQKLQKKKLAAFKEIKAEELEELKKANAAQLAEVTKGIEAQKNALKKGYNEQVNDAKKSYNLQVSESKSATEKISSGISAFVENLTSIFPEVINIGFQIVEVLANTLIDNLPTLAQSAFDLVAKLGSFLVDALPNLANSAVEIVVTLGNKIAEAAPKLITGATTAITKLAELLTNPEQLGKIFNAGLQIITEVGKSLIDNVGEVTKKVPDIIQNVVDFLTNTDSISNIINAGTTLMTTLLDNADEIVGGLMDGAFAIIDGIINFLVGENGEESGISKMIDAGFKLVGALFENVDDLILEIAPKVVEFGEKLINKIKETDWLAVGGDIAGAIWDGLESSWNTLVEGVDNLWNEFQDWLHDAQGVGNGIRNGDVDYETIRSRLHTPTEEEYPDTPANVAHMRRYGYNTPIVQYNYYGNNATLADTDKANMDLVAALGAR